MNISEPHSRRFPLSPRAISAGLVLIAVVGSTTYFLIQQRLTKKIEQQALEGQEAGSASEDGRVLSALGPNETVAQDEAEQIVSKVSEIALLPEGETPTLSIIKNIQALTENREFFVEAKEGDAVLLYPNAKKAYLYRPAIHKIINMAPVIATEATIAPTATPSPSPTPQGAGSDINEAATVVLMNGTSTAGLTGTFGQKLTDAFANIEVTDRINAARSDYDKSIVISVNQAKQSLAELVATTLGLEVTNLPESEETPEADILIIVGADQAEE